MKIEKIIKSKKRVKENAEVFTPNHIVNDMLNLIPEVEYKNPLSKWFEPSCGNGNFLIEIIKRKLSYYDTNNKDSQEIYCLKILSNIYAVELMQDNIDEAIERILKFLDETIFINDDKRKERFLFLANSILYDNIQIGNFLKDQIFYSHYNWDENNNYTILFFDGK